MSGFVLFRLVVVGFVLIRLVLVRFGNTVRFVGSGTFGDVSMENLFCVVTA